MQYPLCRQTVTVYRKEEDGVSRYLVNNAFYRYETRLTETEEGLRMDRTCLLVVPGNDFVPRAGDRVFDGIGPETVDWDSFLPVSVAGLSELNYAAPQYWMGRLCHTEAGRH